MTKHSRLTLGQLSWLVILLTVSILAAGALTRAFADSPEVTELPRQDQVEVVVVELEPVEVVQGDAPELDPSQGLQPEREAPAVENSTQDHSDILVEPVEPAVESPTQNSSDTPAEQEQSDAGTASRGGTGPQADHPNPGLGINDVIDMWMSDDIDMRGKGSHLASNLLKGERERIRNQVIQELGPLAFATFDVDEPPEGERRAAELEQKSPVFKALSEALGSNDPEVAARARDTLWERCEDCGLQYEDGPCSDCFSPTFDLSDPEESDPGQSQPFHEDLAGLPDSTSSRSASEMRVLIFDIHNAPLTATASVGENHVQEILQSSKLDGQLLILLEDDQLRLEKVTLFGGPVETPFGPTGPILYQASGSSSVPLPDEGWFDIYFPMEVSYPLLDVLTGVEAEGGHLPHSRDTYSARLTGSLRPDGHMDAFLALEPAEDALGVVSPPGVQLAADGFVEVFPAGANWMDENQWILCIIVAKGKKWSDKEVDTAIEEAQKIWQGKVKIKRVKNKKECKIKQDGKGVQTWNKAVQVSFSDASLKKQGGGQAKSKGGAYSGGLATVGTTGKDTDYNGDKAKDAKDAGVVLAHELGHVMCLSEGGNLPGPNDKGHDKSKDGPKGAHNLMEEKAPGTHLTKDQIKQARKCHNVWKVADGGLPELPGVPGENQPNKRNVPGGNGGTPQDQQPNNPGAQGNNPNSAPPSVSGNQDDPQKAKRKEIADDLRERGYRTSIGYRGGKGLVTGRKYDRHGNLVEEHKYEIDKGGKVTREAHRTIIRNDNGNLKGETITTVFRSGGKTVTITENRETSSLGTTTGGTMGVVTEEPGKKDKVEKFNWWKGRGWVKQWTNPDLGALPGDPPAVAEGQRDPQPEPKAEGPDRPELPTVDPRRLPKEESKHDIPPLDKSCQPDGAKPCPLGCDAVPAKGLCGQYYLWWPEHHQHEWAVHSDHFECVPDMGDIDFKVGCLWPDPAKPLEIEEYLADPAVQAEIQVRVQELSEFLNQVGQEPSDTQDAPDPAGLSDEELRRRLADPNTGFDEWKVLLKEFRSRQQSQSASAAGGGKPATVQDLQDQINQLKRELAIKELWRQYRRAQDRASRLLQNLIDCEEDLYTDTAVGLFTFGIGTLVQEIFGGGAGNTLIDCVKLKGEYDAAKSGADRAYERWKAEAFRR